MRQSIGEYIKGNMIDKFTQSDLADDFHMTQARVSQKINKSDFTFEEMQHIIKKIGLTDEEILDLVKRGHR